MEHGNERNNTFFRFEDLRIYHKALNYTQWVNENTRTMQDNKHSGLVEHFNASSHNIVLNIAEGSARNKSQFIYYLKMAKSAVRECLVFTSIMHQLELLDQEAEDDSRNQLMEMTKMIGALISSLQRSNSRKDDDDNDNLDSYGDISDD